jgi:hypothetical protein
MKGIPGRPGWLYVFSIKFFKNLFSINFSYKCDSQCALEMRCPPGLIFDDIYQRCEWPGAGGNHSPKHRLSSLRNKKEQIKVEKKQIRLMTTIKQRNSTVSPLKKMVEP